MIPNRIQLVNKEHKFNFESLDTYKVNILEGFKTDAVFCKGGNKCDNKIIKGKWTMIYD